MRSKFPVLLVVLSCLLAISGCGSNTNNASNEDAPSNNNAVAEIPPGSGAGTPDPSIPTPPPRIPVNGFDPNKWVYGVTLDDLSQLSAIVDSLKSLPKRPTVRIVFDEKTKPTDYSMEVESISKVAFTKGEILDSFFVKQYTPAQYQARAQDFYQAFANQINVWEVGNEINGDWLGAGAIGKAEAAHNFIRSRGGLTSLTLYYNKTCEDKNGPMLDWVRANVPLKMRTELKWVSVSYYEDDCNNRIVSPAEWTAVFSELSQLFPNSKLMIGEAGSQMSGNKESYMRRYFGLRLPQVPNYLGGVFWWYGKQDIVPRSKPLWSVLSELFLLPQ